MNLLGTLRNGQFPLYQSEFNQRMPVSQYKAEIDSINEIIEDEIGSMKKI